MPTTAVKENEYDPGKLVWVCSSSGDMGSPDVAEPTLVALKEGDPGYEAGVQFNKLLKEKGFDIEIEFVNLCIPLFADESLYRHTIDDMIRDGEQIDIVRFWGQSTEESFLDISDFYNTETGQKLISGIDKRVWDLLGDNMKYLVPQNRSPFGEKRAYLADKRIMQDYQISEDQLKKPLKELEPLFEQIKAQEKQNGLKADEVPLNCCSIDSANYLSPMFANYAVLDCFESEYIPFLLIDKRANNGKVENLYENEEFIDFFHLLKGWVDKEIINSDGNYENQKVFLGGSCYNNEILRIAAKADGYTLIPVGETFLDTNPWMYTSGIAKSCRNPELAFEIMATMLLDSDFSDENGLIKDPKTENEEMIPYDSMGFYPNWDNLQEEYDRLHEVVRKHFSENSLWRGEAKDVDAELAAINAELKTAGLDKVPDELNRRLDEFYSKK